jgi:uncharacterized membrane protein (DUF2068 family)
VTESPAPEKATHPGKTSWADKARQRSASPRRQLTTRESRWLLRRCGRRGHVLARVNDPLDESLTTPGPDGLLIRCLRCGTFTTSTDTGVAAQQFGAADAPVPLSELPLVLRGSHGRKLALLRLLALERGGRGLLLVGAAAGLARLATSHVAVAEWLGQVATAAQPLANQLGWDLATSQVLTQAQSLLGTSSGTFTLIAWLAAAYGGLQIVEGVGLWGGWRWAEYLAAIATSLFIPLEVYEMVETPTLFKAGALVVNIVAVGYLVLKGRLFGVRGGHTAYLAEVREATLLADELARVGRPTEQLSGRRLI